MVSFSGGKNCANKLFIIKYKIDYLTIHPMSSYEAEPNMTTASDPELIEELYASFQGGIIGELTDSLAQEPDPTYRLSTVCNLATLGYEEAIPFLEEMRLTIAKEGVTNDNRTETLRVAKAYADLGKFDVALEIADSYDGFVVPKPGRTDLKTLLFRTKTKQIPDVFLERAVLTLTKEGGTSGLNGLYMLGTYHPPVRKLALGVVGQIMTKNIYME